MSSHMLKSMAFTFRVQGNDGGSITAVARIKAGHFGSIMAHQLL